MLPEFPLLWENCQTVKMLAVLEKWEAGSCHHSNNVAKYFFLLLFKLLLDTAVLYTCRPKRFIHFLNVCSLSIVIADFLLTVSMGVAWIVGGERSFVSACFLLANASVTYGAIPLPMICLGLIDYCLEETCMSKHTACYKLLRNVIFTLLVWIIALVHSFSSFHEKPVLLDYIPGKKTLVCKVEESTMITVVILGLFFLTFFTTLPFCSRIPMWVKEADKIYEAREKQENTKSDLFLTSDWKYDMETFKGEEKHLENIGSLPPLWFSLMLGFMLFWMPYLIVILSCLLSGFAVPAHISVNLLWLECTNSFMVGLLFWVKSKTKGPHNHLPENVCSWHIYWHLSKGTAQPRLPIALFNPSQAKRNVVFHM
ncbi:probable G-protein coupled receptor 160 [Nothobranchius furzeri]|uniref:G protein-coupled receptor 160 n=2 Tax=Nothobranchius furzeri TaxID=105023 RepID=A0A9D3BGW9_NOTFU|nr:G protein-coupled receptor 160 [Nothobranchius furzeri]